MVDKSPDAITGHSDLLVAVQVDLEETGCGPNGGPQRRHSQWKVSWMLLLHTFLAQGHPIPDEYCLCAAKKAWHQASCALHGSGCTYMYHTRSFMGSGSH